MVNVVGMPGNKSAVEGDIVNDAPGTNLIVTFAVTAAFVASRTVMSTTVSAVTAFGITVNVEPVTFAVMIGNAPLLLENAE